MSAEAPPLIQETPEIAALLDGNNSNMDTSGTRQQFSQAPVAPASSASDKVTIVSPDKGQQPPAKPTGSDVDDFENLTGISLGGDKSSPAPAAPKAPDASVNRPTAQQQPVAPKKAPADSAEQPVAPAAKQPEKFEFDPFKSTKKKQEEPPSPETEETTEEMTTDGAEVQPIAQQQPPAGKRDYTGLSEEEVKAFKKMGNEAYAFMRPKYDAWKKGQSRPQAPQQPAKPSVPESYFAHPDAHTLLPEYRQVAQMEQRANIENRFWQQQLAKIRAGEKWHELAIDDKGQYVLGDEREANAVGEGEIINNLTKTNSVLSQAKGQMQYMQAQAGNIYQQAANTIRQAEKSYMPFYEAEDNPHAEQIKAVIQAFPAPFQNHPLASIAAKLAVMSREMRNQLQEMHQERSRTSAVKQEAANRQPNNKSLGAAISQPASNGKGPKPSTNGGDDIEALNKALGEMVL